MDEERLETSKEENKREKKERAMLREKKEKNEKKELRDAAGDASIIGKQIAEGTTAEFSPSMEKRSVFHLRISFFFDYSLFFPLRFL